MRAMNSTKLSELVCSLSAEEFRKFGEFVKSPYFNRSKRIIKLYGLLKKKQISGLSKRAIHDFMFPGESYKDERVRLVISDLVKLLETFLVVRSHERNSIQNEMSLAMNLRTRNASKCFNDLYSRIESYYAHRASKDSDDYINLINLYKQKYIIENSHKLRLNGQRSLITAVIANINKNFIFSRLLMSVCLLQNQMFEKICDADLWLDDSIIDFIELNVSKIKEEDKLIYLNYLIYMLYKRNKKESFIKDITEFLGENHADIPIEGLTYIYNTINHYFIHFAGSGDLETKAHFAIISMFGSIKYFDKLKNIDGSVFFNVVNTSIESGNLKYAEDFYSKYEEKIHSYVRKDIKALANSLIHIERRKFREALNELSKLTMANHEFYLKMRNLQVIIFYETHQNDAAFDAIDASSHFLRRNRHAQGARYESHIKFYHYIKTLLRFRDNFRKYDPIIKKRLSEDKVASKSWLIKKFEDAEKYWSSLNNNGARSCPRVSNL